MLWYEWRTGTVRFSDKNPRPQRGDWPRCGAHCKGTGQPCRARALANGRCKYHGGLSTGPKTPAGKTRAIHCFHRPSRRRICSRRSNPARRWRRVSYSTYTKRPARRGRGLDQATRDEQAANEQHRRRYAPGYFGIGLN